VDFVIERSSSFVRALSRRASGGMLGALRPRETCRPIRLVHSSRVTCLAQTAGASFGPRSGGGEGEGGHAQLRENLLPLSSSGEAVPWPIAAHARG
jgi:hypothetical protein